MLKHTQRQNHHLWFTFGGLMNGDRHMRPPIDPQWPSLGGDLGLHTIPGRWEVPILNRTVPLRPLLGPAGHDGW